MKKDINTKKRGKHNLKYYKCTKCGFEFCRVGKVESCPYCNDKYRLKKMLPDEEQSFIQKHMSNRKNEK